MRSVSNVTRSAVSRDAAQPIGNRDCGRADIEACHLDVGLVSAAKVITPWPEASSNTFALSGSCLIKSSRYMATWLIIDGQNG